MKGIGSAQGERGWFKVSPRALPHPYLLALCSEHRASALDYESQVRILCASQAYVTPITAAAYAGTEGAPKQQ